MNDALRDTTDAAALLNATLLIREVVSKAGTTIATDVYTATESGLAPFRKPIIAAEQISRDLFYGPHERQRFTWFRPLSPARKSRPKVLVFVHGGGFAVGDKRDYDNIGTWAATNGLYAATINYRLAPDHQWPAGAEDVRAAAEAIAEHARRTIGETPLVYVMGQSAGAVHVASAITIADPPATIAGCILVSGFYDNTVRQPKVAYFGDDPGQYARQSSLPRLTSSGMSLFLVVAEFDPAYMHADAAAVLKGRIDAGNALPQFTVLDAHNHYSPTLVLNSTVDAFGPRLLEFIGRPHGTS